MEKIRLFCCGCMEKSYQIVLLVICKTLKIAFIVTTNLSPLIGYYTKAFLLLRFSQICTQIESF